MRFDWDSKKNPTDIGRQGVSFEEAREVFDDPLHIALLDHRFNYFEERWITIGRAKSRRLIVVVRQRLRVVIPREREISRLTIRQNTNKSERRNSLPSDRMR